MTPALVIASLDWVAKRYLVEARADRVLPRTGAITLASVTLFAAPQAEFI
jgi:hypothetical protein